MPAKRAEAPAEAFRENGTISSYSWSVRKGALRPRLHDHALLAILERPEMRLAVLRGGSEHVPAKATGPVNVLASDAANQATP